jgi:acetyltransferase
VIAADATELAGFNLGHFPDSFLREIEQHFRASVIRLTNPLDLGDLFDLDVYAEIFEQTLQLEDVDGIVFLHTSLSDSENLTSRKLLDRMIDLVEKYDKPIAYYISAAAEEVNYLKQNYDFPIFTQVVETIRALGMSHHYYVQTAKIRTKSEILVYEVDRPGVEALISRAKAKQRDLLISEALQVLELYGIPTVPSQIAKTDKEAQAAAEEIGYPVAMKVIAAQISH